MVLSWQPQCYADSSADLASSALAPTPTFCSIGGRSVASAARWRRAAAPLAAGQDAAIDRLREQSGRDGLLRPGGRGLPAALVHTGGRGRSLRTCHLGQRLCHHPFPAARTEGDVVRDPKRAPY